jgi:hypothetical protein
MSLKELTTEQKALLKKPLPTEAVKQHPTKTFLSTIKAIYEVERLNEVFGIGKWHLRSEIIDNKTAMIVVKSTLTIPEYGIELESYGGNDNGGENSKNHDLGDAYKGATTDAFTKICSFLEIGIDVYKGKQSHGQPAAGEQKPTDDKPWLNENSDAFVKAIEYLSKGHSIKDIEKKYKISKKVREALLGSVELNHA